MSELLMASELGFKRQTELKHLVKHDCGSCHGMTLKGGLGPSLLIKDLSQKSYRYLFNTIYYGREQLAMPAWKDQLSEADINWVIKFLKGEK